MSRKGWALFAAMCLLWGVPYLFIKVAVGGIAVPVVVFARTALGAVLLLPLALRPGYLDTLRRHWRPLAAFTVLEIAAPWGLLSQAERRLPSSLAGLLIAAVPIIGVVVARLTGGTERLSPRRWAGLITGLAGVAVLAAPDLTKGSGWPIAEMLLVAVGYATAPIIAARKLADVPPLPMTAACLTAAALVYTPAAILNWPHRMPTGQVLASLAALGVFCTACAFIVFLRLIKEVGTSRAMVFTYINPVVAVAAGVALLGETLTVTIVTSFVLIIAGCVLATVRQRDQQPQRDQQVMEPAASNLGSLARRALLSVHPVGCPRDDGGRQFLVELVQLGVQVRPQLVREGVAEESGGLLRALQACRVMVFEVHRSCSVRALRGPLEGTGTTAPEPCSHHRRSVTEL